ncbi:MAG: SEC-C metal-binding domain-containing protein, partial [Senegalimassilia anaerobia]|uniref:preprotein translocase subunit SecA n=1 Tax=Senegalimassilia anaerobia TaxID=1473216 RepID=UPI002E75F79C
LVNHLQQALKAQYMFHRDKQYVVTNGEVKIVDEFTGRIMEGRRYSEGLHQAIEAKEGVLVREENQTLATITLQNYFRLYDKLSGMTGTALTEDAEFREIYKLPVEVIPPNKPVQRVDHEDLVYRTIQAKYNAVADDVERRHAKGQPVLVGTVSIESSEKLSAALTKRGIAHEVLNAKHHEREAHIVAQAGRYGAVTIATNMAGRGTDIKLTPEVKAAGGLAIIGTERHESRRVDRQLRGRAGRQGDPGSSQFFVSLEDDLMRLFGSGRIASMMDRMGLKEGEVIQAGMMTRAIERAQKKVEENNFGIRKRLLEYDDVMNSQREVIYTRRRHALYGERIEIDLNNIMYDYADNFVEVNRGIEFEDFRFELIREVAIEPSFDEATYGSAKPAELAELIVKDLKDAYARRAKSVADTVRPVMERIYEDRKEQLDSNIYFPITDGHLGYNVPVNLLKCKNSDGAEIFRVFSKVVMFTSIDDAWREHLREMDDLRQSVQNATYEQKDPLLIYKFESFGLFSKMIVKVNRDVLAILNKAYIPVRDQNAEAVQRERQERAKVDVNKLQASRMQAAAQAGQQDKQKPMPLHVEKKVGRNDPCPCGSGKKYKQCHGKGI